MQARLIHESVTQKQIHAWFRLLLLNSAAWNLRKGKRKGENMGVLPSL